MTPLLALLALLAGVFAVLVTPREEEPQIDVTLANVFVRLAGASAGEVESLIGTPMEQVLSEIEGVEHVYTTSMPGLAVASVQFEVGERRNDALVRLYNAVQSHQDWLPPALGVPPPLVKPRSIDDVPVVTLTLWSADPAHGAQRLLRVAHAIEAELKRVPGTREVYTVGGPDSVVHVRLDAQRLAAHELGVAEVAAALTGANVVRHAGALVADDLAVPVQAGTFLAERDDVADLVVGVHDGRPVFLRDVAEVVAGPDQPESYVWFGHGVAAAAGELARLPLGVTAAAVTVAVAKKPGDNAVVIAARVLERVEQLRGLYIPDDVQVTVTRNYGATAEAKAQQLVHKLGFATACVVALVMVTLGWRAALVVGIAVVVTLMAALFASWAWGFTLNRVSLFALIFSIGILVDDAIVVVENIHRHMGDARPPGEIVGPAVDEVGGPTVLATFTVIAALMPMAFVGGLMGPYMTPIPINASSGMLISLLVALVLTPWLCLRLLRPAHPATHDAADAGWLGRLMTRVLRPFLRRGAGRRARYALLFGVLVGMLLAVSLVGLRAVVLKMLPFDNKSEFQVVVDLPEGASVERTAMLLDELAAEVARVPEVTDWQAYAGSAAPIGFNGLVRQYYLRAAPQQGDLQVNLLERHARERSSHQIAAELRPRLAAIAARYDAALVLAEVPPGPPVRAPLVAEVYGPDADGQARVTRALRDLFAATPGVVDVDDSIEAPAERLVLHVDRERAARLGVSQAAVVETIDAALNGLDATYLRTGHDKHAVPVRIELPVADKARLDTLLALEVRTAGGAAVPLSELVRPERATVERAIHHKDGLRVSYVTGDVAGDTDSPLYGMFSIAARIAEETVAGEQLTQHYIAQPENPYLYSVKWDGEWQITYETFRDMGLAYSVGLVLIYLLVVAEFGSYVKPLVIMVPIPLTVLGVLPGHWLMGAHFTATSMIGMIALAGIIVRNSILLVDFAEQQLRAGLSLEDAVTSAAAVRARPIVLTALAAILGALFILDDPIFSGLAVSMVFGLLVSTLLTLVVIPVLFYVLEYRRLTRLA